MLLFFAFDYFIASVELIEKILVFKMFLHFNLINTLLPHPAPTSHDYVHGLRMNA